MSHKVHEANQDFKARGIEVNSSNVKWLQAQKNKDSIVTSLTEISKDYLKRIKLGI